MKMLIAIIGAFCICGIMWRQEWYFIYHRPASSFSAWGMTE